MLRQADVSLAAAALEVLVPTTFPLGPQFAPKHGAASVVEVSAAAVVGEAVVKKPC
jgi:hypothetical protein